MASVSFPGFMVPCGTEVEARLMNRLLIIKQELINSRRLVTLREEGTLEIHICK